MIDKNFIAIDLELNQPSNRIIQVGVAIGNAYQSADKYIVRKWYIDPNEPIDTFIVGLTGITSGDIRSFSVGHQTVARELSDLIKEHQPWLNPIVWGYDDAGVLRREFEKNKIEFKHLGGRWIDLKTIYNFLQFSKDHDPKGNLQQAMSITGLWFEGDQHRADIDACNTLKFWFHLMKKQKTMFDLLENNQYNIKLKE